MASINLGEHFEKFVQHQIEHGRYQNVSEVVRAGLRLLEDYERKNTVGSIEITWDDCTKSYWSGGRRLNMEALSQSGITQEVINKVVELVPQKVKGITLWQNVIVPDDSQHYCRVGTWVIAY
jgi:putative addiction module CopG family antidote